MLSLSEMNQFKLFRNRVLEQSLYFQILQNNPEKGMVLLKKVFEEEIVPVYGDQSEILKKIEKGIDRTTEFLVSSDNPVGVLVYKNKLSDEFKEFKIENCLELKTVLLFERKTKFSGHYLRFLLSRAAQKALQMEGNGIFGTVSSQRTEVLKIMCKLGFKIFKTFHGKYVENIDEYLICHENPISLVVKINEKNEAFLLSKGAKLNY